MVLFDVGDNLEPFQTAVQLTSRLRLHRRMVAATSVIRIDERPDFWYHCVHRCGAGWRIVDSTAALHAAPACETRSHSCDQARWIGSPACARRRIATGKPSHE